MHKDLLQREFGLDIKVDGELQDLLDAENKLLDFFIDQGYNFIECYDAIETVCINDYKTFDKVIKNKYKER